MDSLGVVGVLVCGSRRQRSIVGRQCLFRGHCDSAPKSGRNLYSFNSVNSSMVILPVRGSTVPSRYHCLHDNKCWSYSLPYGEDTLTRQPEIM